MIGMNFLSFIILLVISIIVSAVMHYGMKYYIRPGFGSFLSKMIFGWIGAWLGTPVFGEWWGGVNYQDIYFVPAILGSIAVIIIIVDLVKTTKSVVETAESEPAPGGTQEPQF